MTFRRQATLYLPPPYSAAIDRLRAIYNPAQHALIRAHVTLCREDEVEDWSVLERRLLAIAPVTIPLAFAMPVRAGDLVYVPTIGSIQAFDQVRSHLLARPGVAVRQHEPHITLVHPRNGSCSEETFAALLQGYSPFDATFREVTLIGQVDNGPWMDLDVA